MSDETGELLNRIREEITIIGNNLCAWPPVDGGVLDIDELDPTTNASGRVFGLAEIIQAAVFEMIKQRMVQERIAKALERLASVAESGGSA